jgi:hypothetical protein
MTIPRCGPKFAEVYTQRTLFLYFRAHNAIPQKGVWLHNIFRFVVNGGKYAAEV